jgi:hypothetical protein
MICPTTGRMCEKLRLGGSSCPYPCLPRVYVLELACDWCDHNAVIYAPVRGAALTKAVNNGWYRERHGRLFCPSCAPHQLDAECSSK